MTKGLDLAEAGLSLGINLVERFGATIQDQVSSRLAQARDALAGTAAGPVQAPAAPESQAAPRPQPEASARAPSVAAFSGVVNRLPLFPGSPVHVSFSINNDSPDVPRRVQVRLEGLTGEVTGTPFNAGELAVEPGTREIAPMDFEKFVITGIVPMGLKSDAYSGWIVVSGQHQLRIPLRLVITAPT